MKLKIFRLFYSSDWPNVKSRSGSKTVEWKQRRRLSRRRRPPARTWPRRPTKTRTWRTKRPTSTRTISSQKTSSVNKLPLLTSSTTILVPCTYCHNKTNSQKENVISSRSIKNFLVLFLIKNGFFSNSKFKSCIQIAN